MPRATLLRVRGTVQGVGFRPFVWRLAQRLGVQGWVKNDAEGVLVAAAAAPEVLEVFQKALVAEAPPAARVLSVEVVGEVEVEAGFAIVASEEGSPTTLISPDLAVCNACLAELSDPQDRRYRYPFINCTHCGPRYSIILDLPYDRARTTMRTFSLCEDCAREYQDPADRRYHAQPVACPRCGPTVYLTDGTRRLAEGEAAVELTTRALAEGRIVAIKGLGGYHLAVDAKNAEAVARLRERKYRKDKPFALMARDLKALAGYVVLSAAERALLTGAERPIVLLAKGSRPLPDALAPANAELGVMLPYTPLHYLLYRAGAPELLVMTSANRSSEPIAYRDEEALERLQGLADLWLVGTRPIARRVDDSVARVVTGEVQLIRRARGYAPAPVASGNRWQRPLLALGGMLKNAVALVHVEQVFVSQHLGDLENLESYQAFEETLADLTRMYRVELEELLLVHDLHPDYPSTRYAREHGAVRLGVQHHEAHIASVLAEHDAWEERVVGLAFDGTGLGRDGAVWGGELLVGSLAGGFSRRGHLKYAPLPGGDAAARWPAQAAAGFLYGRPWAEAYLPEKGWRVAQALIKSGTNAPLTSSTGRLFDAVAGLLGFHRRVSFEGQAAIWLEHLARKSAVEAAYPLPWDGRVWDFGPLFEVIREDLEAGCDPRDIARRFHLGLARAAADAAIMVAYEEGLSRVALSGGVWQNRLLFEATRARLHAAGLEVWFNRRVPPNDGGLALGQAALAQTRED